MSNSNIKRSTTFNGPVSVDKVEVNPYKKDFMTAQLRQSATVTTTYPGGNPNAGLNDSIFEIDAFGDVDGAAYDSNQERVAWIDVPAGSTQEQVEAQLAKFSNARIVTMLSNEPIVTDAQKAVIESGQLTVDQIAHRQLVRFPEGHPEGGQPALDGSGKLQYKLNVFSADGSKSDTDNRSETATEYVPQGMEKAATV